MKYRLLLILLSIGAAGYAQNEDQKREIRKHTNIEELRNLQRKFIKRDEARKQKVEKFSKLKGWDIRLYKEGKLVGIAIDVNEDGSPIYQTSHNADAAVSTRTNYLYPNGGLNLSLEGEDMLMGIWEAEDQVPLASHIEFTESPFDNQSRIDIQDPSSSDGYHATHVAGTMIARGSNPFAKGMAPKANLNAYNSFGDQTEVISEINNNSLLISNHSYGIRLFNENGTFVQSNDLPGKYTQSARSWDQVHYSAPYYLMVVSAGNDGGNSYSGSLTVGGDKLTGEKVSKNNLVIANAQDAQINNQGDLVTVNIHNSSSQGPADDRRIKPDIAGNGAGVESASNDSNQAYGLSTGTSMSAPNVSGTLLLLQELYSQKNNGNFMRSATLKGLVCHTADDAGNPGPDPEFGWGLLNAKRAAEAIIENDQQQDSDKADIIKELTLNQGQTYTIQVAAEGGNVPLKASITWTDFPGSANNGGTNDPTAALVNNLDIRITDNNGQEFLPWQLSFFDPKQDAIKVDNNLDNVERVDVENPIGDQTYTITVTHKGNLTNGSQDYSLVITGAGGTLSTNDLNKNQVSIWPNPAGDQVNFTSPNGFSDATINIYDLNGRVVKTFADVTTAKTFSGDITGLSAGVYIAKLTDANNGSIQKRIIKK